MTVSFKIIFFFNFCLPDFFDNLVLYKREKKLNSLITLQMNKTYKLML